MSSRSDAEPIELPELLELALDASDLEHYGDELARVAAIEEIRRKRSAHSHSDAGRAADVRAALDALARGDVSALQIVYRLDGGQHCDTLLACPGARYRLIRRTTGPATGTTA